MRALFVAVLLAAGLTGSAAGGPADAAPAQTSGPCTTAEGVTVIVSFNGLGGRQTETRCAPGPSSGFNALSQVGLSTTQPQRMPGFMCRIDGLPTTDPCINTPPTTAYWSYWVAPRGGSWCYSNLGPGRTPPPGTVEGWSFKQGSGGAVRPAISPPPPLPGVAPTPLPASHCTTPPAPAPPPPPTTSPQPRATHPPAPQAPAPAAPSPAPAPSPSSPSGGESPSGDQPGPDPADGDSDDGGADGEKSGDDDEAKGDDSAGEESSNATGGEGDDREGSNDAEDSAAEEAAVLDAWEERAEAAAGDGPAVGSGDSSSSDGGSPWPLVVVAVLVGGLAVGGYLRNRRTWTA